MKQPGENNETLRELAARVLTEHDGDVIKATEALAKLVFETPFLYRQIADPLIRQACYDLMRTITRSHRSTIYHMPQPTAKEAEERLKTHAKGLMAMPLRSGHALGKATRTMLLEESAFYHAPAIDMLIKARWFALIAEAMPDDETAVEECMKEAVLHNLREKARKSVSATTSATQPNRPSSPRVDGATEVAKPTERARRRPPSIQPGA